MRHRILVLAFCGALLEFSSFADSFKTACPDIPTCAQMVGTLLGQKYIYDKGVKGTADTTSNVELTKDNAEWLFTGMLNLNGYSRVPAGPPATYMIQRIRDAKDAAIPILEATKTKEPKWPETWDTCILKYKVSHPNMIDEIPRVSRNLMPPYARIVSDKGAGLVLVTESAPNLKKIWGIMRDLDEKH